MDAWTATDHYAGRAVASSDVLRSSQSGGL